MGTLKAAPTKLNGGYGNIRGAATTRIQKAGAPSNFQPIKPATGDSPKKPSTKGTNSDSLYRDKNGRLHTVIQVPNPTRNRSPQRFNAIYGDSASFRDNNGDLHTVQQVPTVPSGKKSSNKPALPPVKKK